jgi:threonine dehydrogenase-like Zn-dependent dehydrogenase
MKAVCWYGKQDVRVRKVRDPRILNPQDVIVKVTTTAICGADLHLYDGIIPSMKRGDILGHEFMGEVVETGPAVRRLAKGDRVVVPFAIACGQCFFCKQQLSPLCDNTNPNAWMLEKLFGHTGAGLFGYSHLYGGYAGGQAEYVRVPFADVGPLVVPESLSDEQVLFLSDIFPTGYMAAENCNIQPGDTVAVWGCGPVGQFAIASAYLLGAERVIAIDRVPERLTLAVRHGHAVPINSDEDDVLERLKALTAGRGPDSCIDAADMESHGTSLEASTSLRHAIHACRKGGTVSIPGVYGGFIDNVPMGAAFAKGLTLKMGQAHVHKYMPPLLERVSRGDIDPSFVITHRFRLQDAPKAYAILSDGKGECMKVVLKP